MLEVGVAVIHERVVAVVCVDRRVVGWPDDVGRGHAEVAVFVEPRRMFDASGRDKLEWQEVGFGG